ncbi:cytochrome o ubiquinol oxidase operon protein cyoD [Kaistia soli DSM 19436]|uniref:Cytochrome bo(3) ubiquinol oxidase subunit 4 n=1 Tax=Kaistia soli DSM 19436 TaxID=1122133 RepID=A0A1M5DG27_9HYPH|nr:cytochrome o ubiquinol oxidase subunit IV [Kaistia soli]SHF65959.1 cytochrome o ubiquinol oxidase operon protein cyoD [Kaistia soli DSM 19436]
MSSTADAAAPAGHHHGDDHDHDHAAHPQGTLKSYTVGFVLSVILTAIPFWLVMSGTLPTQVTAITIIAFAVAQIFVHMICFLHMNMKAEGGWSMMALLFTLILVVIALTGSLWVMYHLNTNMMPGHDMSQLP